ncbi:PREDICTED: E3 ubiquitin-protein ligase RNF4-like isoform X1 [Vollenhovia emeryi]|uniref:E3 ubiquitin-protein ligase RNF4-like isoform X1 n=1 Tax=Vollenhovia emeryi TaxID=411798 RepID=UPI0005F46C89|nr:PREDICTED: E3 ubiquitin-protein ligase RNF4-like isoform X1 [Vollenhovia emeryi]
MIRVHIYMGDTEDSTMDDSVVDVSPLNVIDVIDLTKDSPSGSVRSRRLRQRNAEGANAEDSSRNTANSLSHHRGADPPIVLGSVWDIPTFVEIPKRKKRTRTANLNETLTLDTTKDDKEYYTVQSDNREQIPLTCPICLEPLTSQLKPITTRCGHLFCGECLESVIRISKKCPTCKTSITLKSSTRLYL